MPRPERAQVERFEQVEHLQRGNALAVGGQLPHVVPAVVRRYWCLPLIFMVHEILERKIALLGLAESDDLFRDLSLVERLGPLFGKEPIRGRQPRVLEDLPHSRRTACEQVCGRRVGPRSKCRLAAAPVSRDDLAHGKTLFARGNRRRQQFGEILPAELLPQLFPPADAPWHRPRKRPDGRYLLVPQIGEDLARELVRAAPAGVEAVEFLRFGLPIDDEQIAADAAAHRLDEPQHGVRGNRCVRRGSARLEHVEPGLRSERVACRHNALFGHYHRAALVRVAMRTVVGKGRRLPCLTCHDCDGIGHDETHKSQCMNDGILMVHSRFPLRSEPTIPRCG